MTETTTEIPGPVELLGCDASTIESDAKHPIARLIGLAKDPTRSLLAAVGFYQLAEYIKAEQRDLTSNEESNLKLLVSAEWADDDWVTYLLSELSGKANEIAWAGVINTKREERLQVIAERISGGVPRSPRTLKQNA